MPAVVDLRALAEELATDPAYSGHGRSLSKAATAQSCAADLAQAENCIEALSGLRKMFGNETPINLSAIEFSLLYTAVILYERGTSAAGKRGERGSTRIADKLTASQSLDHEAIVRVRQRALAHVYAEEEVGGDIWHRNVLCAIETGDGWKPAHSTRRVHFHGPTFERLKRQLPVAMELVMERFHSHLEKFIEALNSYPLPDERFLKHRVDPAIFFGNANVARTIIEGAQAGERKLGFIG